MESYFIYLLLLFIAAQLYARGQQLKTIITMLESKPRNLGAQASRSSVFSCKACGSNGEMFFDWQGNCLVCEDESYD